jgi:hypothetical protein
VEPKRRLAHKKHAKPEAIDAIKKGKATISGVAKKLKPTKPRPKRLPGTPDDGDGHSPEALEEFKVADEKLLSQMEFGDRLRAFEYVKTWLVTSGVLPSDTGRCLSQITVSTTTAGKIQELLHGLQIEGQRLAKSIRGAERRPTSEPRNVLHLADELERELVVVGCISKTRREVRGAAGGAEA